MKTFDEFLPSGCSTEMLLGKRREGFVALDMVQVERRSSASLRRINKATEKVTCRCSIYILAMNSK